MKVSNLPMRKIIRLVMITSVLIGLLAIIPYVFSAKVIFFSSSSQGILFLLLSIVFIWIVNILLLLFLTKHAKGESKKFTRYLFSYVLCIALVLFVRVFLVSLSGQENNESKRLYIKSLNTEIPIEVSHKHDPYKGTLYIGIVWGIALNTLVLLILDMALLRDKKQRIEVENAELRIQNIEATNQQLKQQIHPHFLFNTLNILKSLIKTDSDKAEDYLIKLSDFLRTSLLSGTENIVKLEEEIKLCHDYLEMQKMRFGDAFNYLVDVPKNIQNSESIPVFSLLSLLENAIKHNQFTDEVPLDIQVTYRNGTVITTNNIRRKQIFTPSNTGLGLENLKKRYRIISGDEVVVDDNGETFSVSIKTLK